MYQLQRGYIRIATDEIDGEVWEREIRENAVRGNEKNKIIINNCEMRLIFAKLFLKCLRNLLF